VAAAMKVKAISRIAEDHTRECTTDLLKVHRNLDPTLRPLHKAKEYKRALNAVKLDKVFAKPFLGSMEGHSDGVVSLAKSPTQLTIVLSGAADGEIRLWDITSRRSLRVLRGHAGAARGLSVTFDGRRCISCGDDGTVRIWQMPRASLGEIFSSGGSLIPRQDAMVVCDTKAGGALRDVDCHWGKDIFSTAGDAVELWSENRTEPATQFSWGADTVLSVRFNPVEPDVFASCGSDRSIALYDVRTRTPIRKLVMQNKCTKLAWNPMEAFNFTVANEDTNLYSFDMRKLTIATCVHKDFVSAVLDVDYSPTGREFVAGSYDRTLRIFDYNGGHSRDVYHLKRMQRVFCTRFSMDGTYVLSGSDDMNVRVWKAEAGSQLGMLLPREKRKKQYRDALKNRFKHMPEIKRITRHQHVPKAIHKAQKIRRVVEAAERTKKANRVAHGDGNISVKEYKPARKGRIVAEIE
jgi:WD repeat and SOF domain-containing protein 1